MKRSLIIFKAGYQPTILTSKQTEDFIREEIIPDYRNSYENAREIENGLELIVIEMAPGPHWGEKTNIFVIYEQHPAYNYPVIYDAVYGMFSHVQPALDKLDPVIDELKSKAR